jgi:hypothetical protein
MFIVGLSLAIIAGSGDRHRGQQIYRLRCEVDNRDNTGGIFGLLFGIAIASFTIFSAVYCCLYEIPWARIIDIMTTPASLLTLAFLAGVMIYGLLWKPKPHDPRKLWTMDD